MDGRGIGVRFLGEARDFSLLHKSRSALKLTQPPPFPRLKRQELEADHSLPSSAEVKKGGTIPPLPHMNEMGI
jgi:hypothetical protein